MPAKPIPDGYHAVTPYLIVKGASQALEFSAPDLIWKFRFNPRCIFER